MRRGTDMLIVALTLVTIIVVHVAGPFPTFFRVGRLADLDATTMVSSLLHGILEEYVFRHLFWSMIPPDLAAQRRVSLVWLNALVFWLVHILLLYHSRTSGRGDATAAYESITYNLSIVFMALMLNAIYLETGPMSLANCILAHVTVLLVWAVFLGGNERGFYAKYRPPRTLMHGKHVVGKFLSDALRPVSPTTHPRPW